METSGADQTLSDIHRQPAAWRAAIDRAGAFHETFRHLVDFAQEIVFLGAGCSHASAHYARAVIQQHFGRLCRAASPMEFHHFPKAVVSVPAKALFVVFSRSGETTETIEAQRYARKVGGTILAVTAVEDSTSARAAHECLALPEILEDGLLPTVSTTGMMVAMQQIGFRQSEEEVRLLLMDRMPDLCAAALETQIDAGRAVARNEAIRRVTFLGSGPMRAAAEAGSLLWRMATGQPADSLPIHEFRHGPMQTCGPDLLLAVMITNAGRRDDIRLAREMRHRGARLLACMTDPIPGLEEADYRDIVGEMVTDYARSALVLPLFQSMAAHRALALGRSPDDLPGQPPVL